MNTTIEKTNEISSALRCRLSQAESMETVDPEAQYRHLLLHEIAQNAVVEASVGRRGLFRRSR